MSEWVDGSFGGWVGGVDGSLGGWVVSGVVGWVVGCMGGWVGRWMGEYTELIDRRVDGWMDGLSEFGKWAFACPLNRKHDKNALLERKKNTLYCFAEGLAQLLYPLTVFCAPPSLLYR